MSTTPCKTPENNRKRIKGSESFGTPMFIPPTPMLQNLGYGTGVEVYRIERSPLMGNIRSPWALKRITKRCQKNKEQSETFNQRLEDEANILKTLVHPNIVGFRGMPSTEDGRAALVMEVCDISLGDLLETRLEESAGPLPAKHIKKVCADIFKALDYLHTSAKLLHGDIKSFNILVKDEFSVCKLCDFGVTLPLNDAGFVDVLSKPDAKYIGTELWSAPEALIEDNEANISTKADIFSFGLVIYECIALIAPHTWSMMEPEEGDNSIVEIDDSVIVLDDSIDVNESINKKDVSGEVDEDDYDMCVLYGTRPPMPESEELSVDYNTVVELFYVCTNQNPEDRPTASSLVNMFDNEN